MYAIVKTGGKQYHVEPGRWLLVERLPVDDGATVSLEPLLYVDGAEVVDGDGLERVSVQARVLGHERGPKLRIVKFKPKRGYRRRNGHRQELTRIEVTSVTFGSGTGTKPAAAEAAPATPAPALPATVEPAASPAAVAVAPEVGTATAVIDAPAPTTPEAPAAEETPPEAEETPPEASSEPAPAEATAPEQTTPEASAAEETSPEALATEPTALESVVEDRPTEAGNGT
jgi:large subunit ribosomal protein L21